MKENQKEFAAEHLNSSCFQNIKEILLIHWHLNDQIRAKLDKRFTVPTF